MTDSNKFCLAPSSGHCLVVCLKEEEEEEANVVMVAAKTTMWLVKILYKQNKSPDFGTENKNLDIGILAVSDIGCVRPYVAHFET